MKYFHEIFKLGHFLKKKMKYKNSDADANGTICNIKSWPVVVMYVKVKKINDLSKPNSVNQVTYGAAKY